MKIRRALVCGPRMPEFDKESGSRRLFDLIEFLREDEWVVSYLAHDGTGGQRYAEKLRQMGIATYVGRESKLFSDEYTPDMSELVECGQFDIVLFSFWHVAEPYLQVIREFSPESRVITDSVDLHFLRQARQSLQALKNGVTHAPLTVDYGVEVMRELNAYFQSDAVLSVSDQEADILNNFAAPRALASTVPDCEQTERSSYPYGGRNGILFVGNFRHPPNVEAAKFLLEEIRPRINPRILADHPIYVVGNEVTEEILTIGQALPNVRVVGWVPSLLAYLYRARVSLTPVLHGAGTKRKLLQAMSAGTPSVSTTIGAEGFEIDNPDQVIVADAPADFARAVERLLTEEALWGRVADAGREFVTAHHSRDVAKRRFREVIEGVLKKNRSRTLGRPIVSRRAN